MVTSREAVLDKLPPDKLQQRENCDTRFHDSLSSQNGFPVIPEKELGKQQREPSPFIEAIASESGEEKSILPVIPERLSDIDNLRESPDNAYILSGTNQEGSSLLVPTREDSCHLPLPPSDPQEHTVTTSGQSCPIVRQPVECLTAPHSDLSYATTKSPLRQSSDIAENASQSSQEGSSLPLIPKEESCDLHQEQGSVNVIHSSHYNQERTSSSSIPKKELDNVHLVKSSISDIGVPVFNQEGKRLSVVPDNIIHSSQHDQEGTSPSVVPKKELDNVQLIKSPVTDIRSPESHEEGKALSIVPGKVSDILQQSQGPDTGFLASLSDQQKLTVSVRPEKVLDKLPLRRNPDVGAQSRSNEGNILPRTPDKPTEDGYNWRKYGQKLVRANKFVRSYYKCTFPNCPAKRQVERAHDGHITDIVYLRKHEHPKPQNSPVSTGIVMPMQARKPDNPSLTIPEEESCHEQCKTSHRIETKEIPQQSNVAAGDDDAEREASAPNKIIVKADNDGDPDSKRQKRESSSVDDLQVYRTNGEPRVVVQTMSEVDMVNDGFRWRKYGQKLVKGNPNPRSYYRCSSAGCPVKKHVERASHDPKVVITTYEGQHAHDSPPARTVNHNPEGADATGTSLNGESRSEPEDKEPVSTDLVVHVSATERETPAASVQN